MIVLPGPEKSVSSQAAEKMNSSHSCTLDLLLGTPNNIGFEVRKYLGMPNFAILRFWAYLSPDLRGLSRW